MSWWYVSSPVLTCAVEVEDGKIVGGAPIVRRFIGQPAKSLGNWLRSQGDVKFERIQEPAVPALKGVPVPSPVNGASAGAAGYVYAWGNNEKRSTLKGRRCRILARGTMRSVLIEFEEGEKVVSSFRALRKEEA